MEHTQNVCFGPFRLDPVNQQLWRGEQEISVRPKPLAVLGYLVTNAGRLVSREELLKSLWPGLYVTKTTVRVCIRELRTALAEDVATPQYIETVGQRGYRFIAPLSMTLSVQGSKFQVQSLPPIPNPQSPIPLLVGRQAELERLHSWLAKATNGTRQVIFVTGEPGIGKTTLVDAFLTQVQVTGQARIARGQCIENYGEGEAYLPVLEALGRMCREPGGDRLRDWLSRHAPTWLVQLSPLLEEAELEALQRRVAGMTAERMLREMAEAIELLTVELPLVMVLEDLHWSDYSTLQLVSYIAQRREPARLLVIGTYRPTDVALSEHPLKRLKQELQVHQQCEELRVELLTERHVETYIAERLEGSPTTTELARVIHRRTDGNPLFMVNVFEDCIRQGWIIQAEGSWQLRRQIEELERSVPESLRLMVDKQLEQLDTEVRSILEVASVTGVEFASATVAVGLKKNQEEQEEQEEIEERCEELVERGHFLAACGFEEWPDGTLSAQYRFQHALYQHVLYERLGEARRLRLHRQVGECKERGYGNHAGEIAAELAVHFERGRDVQRALLYRHQAGESALQRSAYREAADHLRKALVLLQTLPDTPGQAEQELHLQLMLGPALSATQGYAAAEVEQTYTRARTLCDQVGESLPLFPVLTGLWEFYLVRGELPTAQELAEQSLQLAEREQDPSLLLQAHYALGCPLLWKGEMGAAHQHFTQSGALSDSSQSLSQAVHSPTHAGVTSLAYGAVALWFLGYPDQALTQGQAAVALVQDVSHPFSEAFARNFLTLLHCLRREGSLTQAQAERLIAFTNEHGYPFWEVNGKIYRGWALTVQGQEKDGLRQMQQGLEVWRVMGTVLARTCWLAFVAEAHKNEGQAEEGRKIVAEALVDVEKRGERCYEAELYRLKGELLLNAERRIQNAERQKRPRLRKTQKTSSVHHSSFIVHHSAEAEECYQQALHIARHQEAKSLELRATVSLARLWQHQGKKQDAHTMLAEIYNWFTEGFDTVDLKEAKTLLDELSS